MHTSREVAEYLAWHSRRDWQPEWKRAALLASVMYFVGGVKKRDGGEIVPLDILCPPTGPAPDSLIEGILRSIKPKV